jgi:hypothetical protein
VVKIFAQSPDAALRSNGRWRPPRLFKKKILVNPFRVTLGKSKKVVFFFAKTINGTP